MLFKRINNHFNQQLISLLQKWQSENSQKNPVLEKAETKHMPYTPRKLDQSNPVRYQSIDMT
jgi:hypothetical protein